MAIPKSAYFVIVMNDGTNSRAIYTLVNLNQNLLNYFSKFETPKAKPIIVHYAGSLKNALNIVEVWNSTYKDSNRYLEEW